jgi:hypothetical protein
MDGFFNNFVIEIARNLNKNFLSQSVIEVKHLRKAMKISSSDRSSIIFLSLALKKIHELGYISFLGHSPQKFKKTNEIPIDELMTTLNRGRS